MHDKAEDVSFIMYTRIIDNKRPLIVNALYTFLQNEDYFFQSCFHIKSNIATIDNNTGLDINLQFISLECDLPAQKHFKIIRHFNSIYTYFIVPFFT